MARGLVDVHHHVVPVSYFEYLASKGISHPSVFESAESSHLSMMDQHRDRTSDPVRRRTWRPLR